ncbi:hypothetical protein SELMODRAFT_416709 [Selaginella moellendorffii]|uniref:Uncharacterized protein n=1 Tax=Selaginella moellendorffii TaxID=88036 RepID=D8S060_SELML|nr:hypothetical protein SELMODRAFT_416709 [Selaginella moellendorffii]
MEIEHLRQEDVWSIDFSRELAGLRRKLARLSMLIFGMAGLIAGQRNTGHETARPVQREHGEFLGGLEDSSELMELRVEVDRFACGFEVPGLDLDSGSSGSKENSSSQSEQAAAKGLEDFWTPRRESNRDSKFSRYHKSYNPLFFQRARSLRRISNESMI